ncbi:guanylate-binding protein 6-like [Dendronephthya gigantea]|uniref:guanylate-binding protein 6-like n=1 Tax=Dendronephthya gigantea TaxID=151771 RepID=UPI00106B9A2F|nr:guanylate-binding protein 6-like [Dendronephthya gigantea]
MDKFKKVSLIGADGVDAKTSSLPLVLPNNMKYDSKSGSLTHITGVKRTHLEIVPSTLALLANIRDPVAVVSIGGMARSGKSYILSRLLGSCDAFKLGHSMDPETFGIWIGTQVLKTDHFTVLLVDTEGIDSASAEKKNDISLLVLTILLSSYFIFNTLSVPRQSQLEELQCFVQLVTGLRVSREGEDDYRKFSTVFPDFLWLLRDVTLTPTDEKGNEIDPKTFLMDRVLKPSGGFEEKPSDKVAKALKMFFPSIDCIALPPPSENAEIMRNIEQNEDKLSPKFKAAVPGVTNHIFSKIKPKTGYSTDSRVTGAQLACMLETYVKAVNDPSAIPVMETSWQTSLRVIAERFHSECLELYKKGMDAALEERDNIPLETTGEGTTIVSVHRKYYTSAQQHLRKGLGPMSNEAELSKFLSNLQQAVFGTKGKSTEGEHKTGLFHEYWRQNNEMSVEYCEKIRDQLWKTISEKLSKENSGYTYEQLKEDLKRFEIDYRQNAKGPAKEKVYGDFLEFVKSEEKTFSKLQDFKEEEFQEKQKTLEMNARLEEIQEEQRRVEDTMLEEMEEHKRQATKLSEEYNEKIDKMKQEEREVYLQRMREQMEMMESTMTKNVSALQEMASKNMKFIEESVKMAREEAAEQRKQMVEIVKTVQEKNAQIAKDLAEQTKKKRTSPFEALTDFIPVVSAFTSLLGSFHKPKAK